MGPIKRENRFNDDWLRKAEFKPWLARHKTSVLHAFCTVCKVYIHLGSIRLGAVQSHAKGKKHLARLTPHCESIKGWFEPTKSTAESTHSEPSPSVPSTSQPDSAKTPSSSNTNPVSANCNSSTSTEIQSSLSSFVTQEDILKSEIMWALHNTMSHHSHSSSQSANELFRHMFPDSEIAKRFTCGRTKLSYLTTFGLAPYFTDELSAKLKDSSNFVILFDESFNRVTKDEQIDVHVRFWDSEKQCVETRYLKSEFLGHCNAAELLKKLHEATENLNDQNILQISMDGPNVNHKLHRDYVAARKETYPEAPDILDIGSCGLHVIHGAFKTGANASGWNIDQLLRSLWWLFSDSPARRADYTSITKSDVFPLQFCATRWIEDVPVAQRAVEIWENICKYVNSICSGPKSKIPKTCSSWTYVAKAVNDKLTLSKLQAFIHAAKYLSPFLERFQTDKPMVPFLASELHKVLTNIMEKFVLQKVMTETSDWSCLSNIDLNDEKVLKQSKHISIGFQTREALKAAKVSEVQEIEFKHQCKQFYRKIVQKVIERSPLKYSLARNMDVLNPKTIATAKDSKQHVIFENLLSTMKNCKHVRSADCDALVEEHKCFVKYVQVEHLDDFKEYDLVNSLRLDYFFAKYMQNKPQYAKVWGFVRKLLLLSHGQASVERGFSVNKDVLACNMSKKTLVAQRMVTDSVRSELGPGNSLNVWDVKLTKSMLASCKAARMRYSLYQEEQAKQKNTTEQLGKKHKLLEKIEASKSKKTRLESTLKRLIQEADDLAVKAQVEGDLSLLASSNSSRAKAKKTSEEIDTEDSNIKGLKEKLKTVEGRIK